MLSLGVVLVAASMGTGFLGLVKRGYELLVVIVMGLLLMLGFGFMVKGIVG